MLKNPLTIVALLGGIATLVTLSQFAARWRTHGITELREVADFMRSVFGDVIAHGERVRHNLMTDEARRNERRLGDLQKRLRDKKLRARTDDLMDCWKRVLGHAPSPWFGIASIGFDGTAHRTTTDSPERRARVERQVQAARDGRVAVEGVLDRCTAIERWVVT